jgi:hypothetical protein
LLHSLFLSLRLAYISCFGVYFHRTLLANTDSVCERFSSWGLAGALGNGRGGSARLALGDFSAVGGRTLFGGGGGGLGLDGEVVDGDEVGCNAGEEGVEGDAGDGGVDTIDCTGDIEVGAIDARANDDDFDTGGKGFAGGV